MLTSEELTQLKSRLQLSPEACAQIDAVRRLPPSRRVRGARGNVCARYPSRKMGCTIQAESHHVELAAIYGMEHDDAVLEYYDQPPPIPLQYNSRAERPVKVQHTPDFFVIRQDWVGWEEWKRAEAMPALVERMPHRYVPDAGGWLCPPGEAYASAVGLHYRVRTTAEINWILQRNLQFLDDYWRDEHKAVPEDAFHLIRALISGAAGILLSTLLATLDEVANRPSEAGAANSADWVYTLIACERVYVDLADAPLTEPSRVRLFDATHRPVLGPPATPSTSASAVVLAAGACVSWDGKLWSIVNVGFTHLALQDEAGACHSVALTDVEELIRRGQILGVAAPLSEAQQQMRDILVHASAEDLRTATARFQAIRPGLESFREEADASGAETADLSSTPARTRRNWQARYRQAERTFGNGFVGLVPRRSHSGNRTRRLSEEVIALMDQVIETDYETLKRKRVRAVYGELILQCQERGLKTPNYKTFRLEIQRRSAYEQTLSRQGKRAAYAHKPFYWELELTTPRHGERPWEIGHLDHTQLDVEVVCSRTGLNLGRPWATFLVDAYSRRLVAVLLLFDPPSYRSDMMILRECVRRHGRLPQTLVVDNGADFESIYFEALLARYERVKKVRPYAEPHFGTVCERLFGTTNTQLLYNLAGNTQAARQTRLVTQSTDPRRHAVWTLAALYACLCEWAYEIYDTQPHPALGQTPRAAFEQGLARSGQRPHTWIGYDEDFIMTTLPANRLRNGTCRVHPTRGITLHYLDYWSDAFLDPRWAYTRVPTRYDPFDIAVAYAYVGQRWVRCIASHYAEFRGRSERELALLTLELRRQNAVLGRDFDVTAVRLARFIRSAESQELDAQIRQQQLRDAESRAVLAPLAAPAGLPSRTDRPAPVEVKDTPRAKGRRAATKTPGMAPAGPTDRDLTPYEDY